MSSKKGAKRSRRVSDDAPEASVAGGEGGARGGRPSLAAAAEAATTAIVLRLSATAAAAAVDEGAAIVAAITAADVSRLVEEQLRAVRREHARLSGDNARLAGELAAVRRDLGGELAAQRGALGDARYDISRLGVLLHSTGEPPIEMGLVCRRGGGAPGPDEYIEYRSVLSVLFGFQEFDDLGDGLMRFFTTEEACELRLVHSEFRDAVTATPWHDVETMIEGSLVAWRACFPNAQAANVSCRHDLVDADIVHLRGLRALDMTHCSGLSGAALVNLRGCDSLTMLNWRRFSASAFVHLKGIQELVTDCFDDAVDATAIALPRGARYARGDTLSYRACPFLYAIEKAELSKCQGLLRTHALGSASWLYAGVTFADLPAPASRFDVIAMSCLQLLQVGIETGSTRMVLVATRSLCDVTAEGNTCGQAACLVAIPALVATLQSFRHDDFVSNFASKALCNLSLSVAGRNVCREAGAIIWVVSALKAHNDQTADNCNLAITFIGNMWRVANVASLVALGAVPAIVAAYQWMGNDICRSFCYTVARIVCIPGPGKEALVACGAVPLLAAAYAKLEPVAWAREKDLLARVEETLKLLGYDRRGFLGVRLSAAAALS